jgi:CRP-like cAMP-binding protein/Fe-S-cluster-containing hydrogenase component 2
MAKMVMPEAGLEPRPSDVRLTNEQFLQLSLFAALKNKPDLTKFPGTLVLRKCKKDEVVFRQGEAGWTAFYILTCEDVLALQQAQVAGAPQDAALRQRAARRRAAPDDDDPESVAATVYLAVARSRKEQRSPRMRLISAGGRPIAGQKSVNREGKSFYMPLDGPQTGSYDSLKAPLREGDLFGEISCLYRTPRSATVVAQRDCYMVEMLRHILDQIQKDKVYKARADEVYKKRSLELQVRKLSIFSDLTDAEYKQVRDAVELQTVEPGTVIIEEHDRADGLYIVRSGLVKIVKGTSALLAEDDVNDWPALCQSLLTPESEAGPLAAARRRLAQLLPEGVRNSVRYAPRPGQLARADQRELILALNDLIKITKLIDVPDLAAVLDSLSLPEAERAALEARKALLKAKKDWGDAEARRCNRRVLEGLLAGALRRRGQSRAEQIMTYAARGDFIGEISLLLNQPRNATCIAHSHPNYLGTVELVKLPARAFFKLLASSPELKARVQAETDRRRAEARATIQRGVLDDERGVQYTAPFEQLGLIQGQRLMLIDLDRCTRCDECVRACADTHKDGHARLTLDGPRFGKYLVPTTCRSCLDPVCLIGCPVGSIHRGDNKEIVVEDWCIGCGLCADSCPYGSIRMDDLGIIPAEAAGWRFLPASAVSDDAWLRPDFHDGGWLIDAAPFFLDRQTREALASRRPETAQAAEDAVCFRYTFHLTKALLQGDELELELTSLAPVVSVWINEVAVEPEEKPKRDGRRKFTLSSWAKPVEGKNAGVKLRAGTNVLAVRAARTEKAGDVLLRARLDQVRRPDVPASAEGVMTDEVVEKLVTQRAVVCDMCRTLPGRRPACVTACPHEAALRVDARSEFPQR